MNHNGRMDLAKGLVEAARDAGADAVKFQTFAAERMVTRLAKQADYQIKNTQVVESQFEMLKRLELSPAQHFELAEFCDAVGIEFMSSAFDLTSLDLLASLPVKRIKIPSGEITNLPYLIKAASLKLQIILSTGMSTLREIEEAITVLAVAGVPLSKLIVLHCNTEYPTPYADVNLMAMKSIQEKFDIPVGYSDHTMGIEIPIAAVAMGATVIEKHITLDTGLSGPDHLASLDPVEFKRMVLAIRNIELALGNGVKQPSLSEEKNMSIVRKSVHLAAQVLKGETIDASHLAMQRPGNGISPMRLKDIIGKKYRRNLDREHMLTWQDIE